MTAPIYDPNVPQFNSDQLSITQPDFLTNFQTLFTAFSRNHVPLNEANAGNHSIVELIEQLHPIQTDVSTISIYSRPVEGQASQLFFRYQNNIEEFQFTNYQIYNLTQPADDTLPTAVSRYFTVLPGGIIVYFGFFNVNAETLRLDIFPQVATNIISISTCFTSPNLAKVKDQQYRPWVGTIRDPDGVVSKITFNSPFKDDRMFGRYFYLILGNM